jgi:hypothetical protein
MHSLYVVSAMFTLMNLSPCSTSSSIAVLFSKCSLFGSCVALSNHAFQDTHGTLPSRTVAVIPPAYLLISIMPPRL